MANQLEKNKRKLNMLRETNSNIIGEIESMGQQIDLTLPRLEHFMVFLIDLGVITEEQMIESQIRWEHNLKEQIVPIVQSLRERRQHLRDEARKAKRAEPNQNTVPTRVMLDTKPEGVNDPSDAIIIPGI